MEPEYSSQYINSFETSKGNILWGAALTLAWKQFCNNIIKGPIQIASKDKDANKIVHGFNKSNISKADLSPQCYYIKSGFGNKTVQQINEEVAKKFKNKTTEPIPQNMPDNGIISYAYFIKKMQFQYPFIQEQVIFKNNFTQGFKANNLKQKQQILVYNYKDRENFTVELCSTSQNDQIFIIKSAIKRTPERILAHLPKAQEKGVPLSKNDIFQMPCLSINAKHSVKQLVGKKLANEQFQEYFFSQIFEIIKLKIDEKGIKVQNEGVIKLKKCKKQKPKERKQIIIDKPFWIVMREAGKNVYFMAFINFLNQQ